MRILHVMAGLAIESGRGARSGGFADVTEPLNRIGGPCPGRNSDRRGTSGPGEGEAGAVFVYG